jgi:hypothetical protein
MPETGSLELRRRERDLQTSLSGLLKGISDRPGVARKGLLKTHGAVLIGPGVRHCFGEPGDGQAGRRVALNDRREDAWRHEGERRQQANVPLDLSLLLGDLREGRDPALSEVVNPSPGLGDGTEQGVPGFGLQRGPSCRG